MRDKMRKFCEICAGVAVSSSILSSSTLYEFKPLVTSSEESGNSSAYSSANPDVMIGAVIVAPSLFGSTTTMENSEGGPDKGFIIWFRDNVPYTAVEKRAAVQYNLFHNEKITLNNIPFIKVEDGKDYDELLKYFNNSEFKKSLEHIEIMERCFKEIGEKI